MAANPQDEAIRTAYTAGNVAELARAIGPGTDVDAPALRTSVGKTLLHKLAEKPTRKTPVGAPFTLEMATLLLDRGADVNRKDDGGFTPLHYAADALVTELPRTRIPDRAEAAKGMIRLLLARGADPDIKDNEGQTPSVLAGSQTPAGKFVEEEAEKGTVRLAAKARAEQVKNRAALKEGAQGTRLPEDIEGRISAFLGGRRRKTRARKTKRRVTRKRKSFL